MGVKVKEKVAGSGVFWVFINDKGRRASKCIGTEKAANKVREMIEARIKLGESFLPEPQKIVPTLEEYYRQHEKSYLGTAVRQSTRESYEGNFRLHILPALGPMRLDMLTRERIKAFVASLVEKVVSTKTLRLSRSTLRNHCRALRTSQPRQGRRAYRGQPGRQAWKALQVREGCS